MSDTLGFELTLPLDHEAAITRVTDALKAEGFGVLSRIDVGDAIRNKLGVEFRPYAILGACNPNLAHQALTHRADIGLLLPCNVTVEDAGPGQSKVAIIDPDAMMSTGDLGSEPPIQEVAKEARERLTRVAQALQG